MGVRSTIHEWFTGTHAVTFVDVYVLTTRDEILTLFTTFGSNQDLACTSLKAPEPDHTIDFRNDRLLFRLPGLKKLCYTGQATSNLLGFRRLARDLPPSI